MQGVCARLLFLVLLLFVQQSALACAVCCDLEQITDGQYHDGTDDPDACEKCVFLSGAANALASAAPVTPSIDLLAVLSDRRVDRILQAATAEFFCRGPPALV